CHPHRKHRRSACAFPARWRRRGDRIAVLFVAVRKSAFGTKRTCPSPRSMSAYWDKADIALVKPSGEVLRFAGNLSPELSSSDTLLPIHFDPPASFVADRSRREYFLHRRPIGFNPATVMATVTAWWNADLRKLELRAAPHFGNVEDRDGIVIRPP